MLANATFLLAPLVLLIELEATAWLRWRGLIICRTEATVDLIVTVVVMVAWWVVVALTTGLGAIDVLALFGQCLVLGVNIRRWEEHRHHDEDCRFPPRRRRSGGRVRIPQPVIARKVLAPA